MRALVGVKRSSWAEGWSERVETRGAGEGDVVGGDEVAGRVAEADVELAEVVQGEAVIPADADYAVDVLVADAGDARSKDFTRGAAFTSRGKNSGWAAGPGESWGLR